MYLVSSGLLTQLRMRPRNAIKQELAERTLCYTGSVRVSVDPTTSRLWCPRFLMRYEGGADYIHV